jgi:glycosyltransferase involved in cell wall biosynthesis
MTLPLVSCLMPTFNRRAFVPSAIAQFLNQDYAERELVIVDDGTDPIADLVPADAAIRYERLARRTVLGKKRNIACELARGDVLVNWDDDDWFASWRVRYQCEELEKSAADVCGLDRLWFYEPASGRAWRYVFPAGHRKWVSGGTCCFTRRFWHKNVFPEIAVGEDTRFIWQDQHARIVALKNQDFYVALIHPSNTSRKHVRDPRYEPAEAEAVRRLMRDSEPPYPRARPRPPKTTETQSMRLNLGCCDSILSGYVNVDSVPAPGVEVADLRQPWPWAESSVAAIRAHDIIEHLPDKLHTMNEAWRVLEPGGTMDIAVPTTDGPGAFQDPTHVSFWNRRSFLYYEAGNPYRERFAEQYGIRARFRVLRERTESSADGPRLSIVLEAVKA